jgi:hypothetical protein
VALRFVRTIRRTKLAYLKLRSHHGFGTVSAHAEDVLHHNGESRLTVLPMAHVQTNIYAVLEENKPNYNDRSKSDRIETLGQQTKSRHAFKA